MFMALKRRCLIVEISLKPNTHKGVSLKVFKGAQTFVFRPFTHFRLSYAQCEGESNQPDVVL